MTTTFKIHLAVLLLSTVNVANTADLPPLRLRDPGKSVQMRVREYGFKDYTKIGIQHSHHDLGGEPAGKIDRHEHDYADWERRIDAINAIPAIRPGLESSFEAS